MRHETDARLWPGVGAWRSVAVLVAGLAVCVTACPARAATKKAPKIIPAHPDGSRTPPVHRIQLFDDEDSLVNVRGKKPSAEPFSTRTTCNKCHEVDNIRQGWHFNALNPKIDPGRKGEPWILVDRTTGTQIPLSNRKWPGTFRPADLRMSNWEFVQQFGRQMPGGGVGEKVADHDRFDQSGPLPINCLGCHSAHGDQDQTAWAVNVGKYNFRWAAAAASGLALVKGNVSSFPAEVLEIDMPDSDHPERVPMEIEYFASRFDSDNFTILDLARQPAATRCNFCHSTSWAGEDIRQERWQSDQDVHLAAGLTCTDCHRNGELHHIVRGYEGEKSAGKAPTTLTCRGCHMGDECNEPGRLPGRLGAPYPRHVGLPKVHLEKLACTACHSGPWPQKRAGRVKTSRSHALGVHGKHTADPVLPHIASPVFMKGPDDKIAPHHALWPAYWARLRDAELVCPLPVAQVAAAGKGILPEKRPGALSEKYKPPTPAQITQTLAKLAEAMKAAEALAKAQVQPARQHANTTALLADRLAAIVGKMAARLPEIGRLEQAARKIKARLAQLAKDEKKAQDEMLSEDDAVADKADEMLEKIEKEVAKLKPQGQEADKNLAAARKEMEAMRAELAKMQPEMDKARRAVRGIADAVGALAELDGASRAIAAAAEGAIDRQAQAAKQIGKSIAGAAEAAGAEETRKRNAALLAAVSTYKAAGSQISAAVQALAKDRGGCRPGYIAGGKLYWLMTVRAMDGPMHELSDGEKHEAARPYAWPFAHDVRPAGQSLGVGGAAGCAHCHSTDSPLFFGEVLAEGPAPIGEPNVRRMHDLLDVDATYWKLFAMSFVFRPMLKIVAFAASAILGAILLLYGLGALRAVLAWFGAWTRPS